MSDFKNEFEAPRSPRLSVLRVCVFCDSVYSTPDGKCKTCGRIGEPWVNEQKTNSAR
jgi:hypothetical protein